jgi:protein-L-isoaspartate(D-aspartate) O-methyltransferase
VLREEAELRAVEFAHRAGHGMTRILLTDEFRQRIATELGTRTRRVISSQMIYVMD